MKTKKKIIGILSVLCFLFSTALASWGGTAVMELNKKSAGVNAKTSKNPAVRNQTATVQKRGLPDLIVSINATSGLDAGEKIRNCTVTVKNIGKGLARGTQTAGNNGYMVDLTLSSDGNIPMSSAVYSPNFHEDVLLQGGRISVTPDLKPGESKIFDLPNILVIPSDTPSGMYCIGGFVDSQKKVKESNERNNTTCSKAKIKGNEPFQVTFPGMSQDFKLVSGKIKIKVVFNRTVKKASLIPGTNFIVKAEKALNAAGNVTWVDNYTLIWTSIKNYHDLLKFDPDGFFKLIILDSVKTTNGIQLDGDKDGSAGGKFVNDFVIIG